MSVLGFRDISIPKIGWRPPIQTSAGRYQVDFRYQKKPLLVQTNRLHVPFPITKYGDCVESLHSATLDITLQDEFKDWISQLDHSVKRRIRQKKFLERLNLPDSVQIDFSSRILSDGSSSSGYCRYRLKVPVTRGQLQLKLFQDGSELEVPIQHFRPPCCAVILLHIPSLWVRIISESQAKAGLLIVTPQIKWEPTLVLERCLLQERAFGGQRNKKNHDDSGLGKFHKMLALGIPRAAVEQKMRMEQLDPALLDSDRMTKQTDTVEQRVPHPPAGFLGQIQKGDRPALRKIAKALQDSSKTGGKMAVRTRSRSLIPTLKEIRTMLSSLKRVKKAP